MFTQKCRYYCSLLQVCELFAYKHFFFQLKQEVRVGYIEDLILNGTAMNYNFLMCINYIQPTNKQKIMCVAGIHIQEHLIG